MSEPKTPAPTETPKAPKPYRLWTEWKILVGVHLATLAIGLPFVLFIKEEARADLLLLITAMTQGLAVALTTFTGRRSRVNDRPRRLPALLLTMGILLLLEFPSLAWLLGMNPTAYEWSYWVLSSTALLYCWLIVCWVPCSEEEASELPPLPELPAEGLQYRWGSPELKELTILAAEVAAINVLWSLILLRARDEFPLMVVAMNQFNFSNAMSYNVAKIQRMIGVPSCARRSRLIAATTGLFALLALELPFLLREVPLSLEGFYFPLMALLFPAMGGYFASLQTVQPPTEVVDPFPIKGPLFGPLFPKHYVPKKKREAASP